MNRLQIIMTIVMIFTIRCSMFHKQKISSQPMEEIAMLQSNSNLNIFVYSIDDKRVAQGENIRYELAPGVHTFTLRFRKRKTSSEKPIPNSSEFDLAIEAKAGKIYQIEHIKTDDYTRWSTYIVDALNKNIVSYIITNED